MISLFVGDKLKPSFLVEIIPKKKIISIYKPDKYSKNEEDFYEIYSLGKLMVNTTYDKIIYEIKPISYKNYLFVPEMFFKINNKLVSISKKIKEKLLI